MAVVHYIRHNFIPKDALQDNSAAELAAIETPAASGPAKLPPLNPVPTGQRIPIAVAMQLVAAEAAQPTAVAADGTAIPNPAQGDVAAGAALYRTHCQTCHGETGQGGFPVMMVGSAPYVEVTAQPFDHPTILSSPNDAAGFAKVVLHGLPGRMMPGEGTFTRPQMDSLYAYVQQLLHTRQAAPAGGKQ
jgi:mono/diheme cytochrome c family protein